jgi:hypothetical protein
MNLADRGIPEWLAPLRAATRVSRVRKRRPVVNLPAARTVLATAPQLGIERVKDIGIDVANLGLAD